MAEGKPKPETAQKKPTIDLKDITNDQIIKFLEENSTNHKCPVCEGTRWDVMNDKKHIVGMIALPKDGSVTFPPGTLPVAAVQCRNCGYLRFHGLGLIASKL